MSILAKILKKINDWYAADVEPREQSKALRASVFITITISLLSAIYSVYVLDEATRYFTMVWLLTSIGFWISYKRRNLRNWWIKLLIALFMLVVFADYLKNVYQNPFDPRIPLTTLLVWLQTLHSFDLPRRKDLNYSLLVSFILIAITASMSRDLYFAIYLVIYLFSAIFTLILNHLSVNKIMQPAYIKKGFKFSFIAYFYIIIISSVAFVLIPRYEGLWIKSLPVSFKLPDLPNFFGQIKNPAYPSQGPGQGSGNQKMARNKFNPNAYYGFSNSLDLNYRGVLSDKVVMRVKSSEPAYWRGMAFDKYMGSEWMMTYPYNLKKFYASFLPIRIYSTRFLKKFIAPVHLVTQTFYIEEDQSNLVFSAPYAEELYFPANSVVIDNYNSIRSPVELSKGVAYSVVSNIPAFYPKELRKLKPDNKGVDPVYLQLTTTNRVKELAMTITRNKTNNYDKVKALEGYLRANYTYNLDIPEFPDNVDTVDYFLFKQKEGYCEHFASALTIMARAVNVPSRLATGYVTGKFNPFTTYYEVRSSDAHAWVEIYFPHYDWVPFDPTPGYLAILGRDKNSNFNSSILETLFKNIPLPIKQFFSNIWNLIKNVFVMFLTFNWLILAIGVSIGLFTIYMLYIFIKKHPRDINTHLSQKRNTLNSRIITAIKNLKIFLNKKKGIDIIPSQTQKEYSAQVSEIIPSIGSNMDKLSDSYNKARYSNHSVNEADATFVEDNIESIKKDIS